MKQQELTEMFERHQAADKDPSYPMRRRLTPSSMAELKNFDLDLQAEREAREAAANKKGFFSKLFGR